MTKFWSNVATIHFFKLQLYVDHVDIEPLLPDSCSSCFFHPPVLIKLWGNSVSGFTPSQALHFKHSSRTSTASANPRSIGVLVEPHRSFRLHLSRAFGIRSLADLTRLGELDLRNAISSGLTYTVASVVL